MENRLLDSRTSRLVNLPKSKNDVICQMQDRRDKLEHDYENLIEQIRLANQQKFGRNTEKLSEIAGQREEDLKDFPQEEISHDVSRDTLDATYGEGNWKTMPDEIYWQLQAHVNQCDETTVEVIHDDRPAGSKSYMWVHLTGELSPDPKIIVYEYQKTRHSDYPKEYYKNYKEINFG